MNILVLNSGSSSLKYQLLNIKNKAVLAKGLVEKIGFSDSIFSYTNGLHDTIQNKYAIKDHDEALEYIVRSLSDGEKAVISSFEDIYAIGHRVVHGGSSYDKAVLINENVITELEKLYDLAPLHNFAHVMGIRSCQKLMPGKAQVAVFDTAFHQTLSPEAFMYPVPYQFYEKYQVRRYGFHGTSCAYVVQKTSEFLNKSVNNLNAIICHIGNGASVTAIKNGKSFDTSMGFTPLDGLMMGSRCGSVDPAVILFLMEKEGISPKGMDALLNKSSGLKGISGISSDMRDVLAAAKNGNKRAQLAIDMMVHSLRKIIGSYFFELGGKVDAIIFTAGMGEYDMNLREQVIKDVDLLGIQLDLEKNRKCLSKLEDISSRDSRIRVLVVPTNEELMIAMETEKLTK